MNRPRFRELVVVVPVLVVSAAYYWFLGHRRDYLGHFAAGYGASLCAMLVWLKSLAPPRFTAVAAWGVLPATLVCILLGTATEATIFRIARFDELDWCNQSLGAVLAGAAMLAFTSAERPPDREFDSGTILSIIVLMTGGWFAFT